MTVRQRVAIWAASLALVLASAAFAWYSRPAYNVWIDLPPVSLPMPEVRKIFAPGQDGVAPLLVVVENTPEARPQSGLADACLVYAMPTEGRITRFLTAFCDAAPKVVGPVRSARRYMLEIVTDLGGILVHAGYSAEALAMIRNQKISVINEFWTPGPFWRDGQRQMPHNLYTGIDRLHAALEKKPVDARPRGVPYTIGNPPDAGAPAEAITLDYGPLYAVQYRYDPGRRWYLREQDGRPHVDTDGKPIAPVSILVMFVHWWQVQENGIDSSKIDLSISGRLAILTRGRLVEGTWSRSASEPLTLRDAAGRPVVLPRGPVWIEVFPNDRPFSAQVETRR